MDTQWQFSAVFSVQTFMLLKRCLAVAGTPYSTEDLLGNAVEPVVDERVQGC
jgi:hypothetical protein